MTHRKQQEYKKLVLLLCHIMSVFC